MWLKIVLICAVANLLIFENDCFAGNRARIVNGTDAVAGEFPFIVSLRRISTGRHSCGASLIHRAWVLTAAHCVARALPNKLNIQYGSTAINPNITDHLVNVSKIFAHEGYAPKNQYEHDIALLKLAEPISFTDDVQAVRLPESRQETPENETAILIGWGLNATGGVVQTELQKVTLQTFSDEECSKRHETQMHATNICAGVPEGGKGQCSGDSGGPLLVNGTQVGIVSWSRKPCTVPPFPGVFTEVSAYIDWILKTIRDNGEDESPESLEELMSGNMIVSLRHTSNGAHFCAGTIIGKSWVLTAAHCFTYIKLPSDLSVQYGSIELNTESTRRAYVTAILKHEGYNPTITIHDVALLKLKQPLSYTQDVKAVKLPETDMQVFGSNEKVKLLGWGLNKSLGSLQAILQQVELQLLSLTQCRQQLSSCIHASNLCAAATGTGKGQCSGDSGGPLILDDTQIGIVSWSLKPCATNAGVFTNVAFYINWLQEQQALYK